MFFKFDTKEERVAKKIFKKYCIKPNDNMLNDIKNDKLLKNFTKFEINNGIMDLVIDKVIFGGYTNIFIDNLKNNTDDIYLTYFLKVFRILNNIDIELTDENILKYVEFLECIQKCKKDLFKIVHRVDNRWIHLFAEKLNGLYIKPSVIFNDCNGDLLLIRKIIKNNKLINYPFIFNEIFRSYKFKSYRHNETYLNILDIIINSTNIIFDLDLLNLDIRLIAICFLKICYPHNMDRFTYNINKINEIKYIKDDIYILSVDEICTLINNSNSNNKYPIVRLLEDLKYASFVILELLYDGKLNHISVIDYFKKHNIDIDSLKQLLYKLYDNNNYTILSYLFKVFKDDILKIKDKRLVNIIKYIIYVNTVKHESWLIDYYNKVTRDDVLWDDIENLVINKPKSSKTVKLKVKNK